jgi:hypothetical protein
MDKLTDKQKLSLIDGLCLVYHDGKETHKEAEDALGDIYQVAHPSEKCPHADWEVSTVKLAKDLAKYGVVDVFKEGGRVPVHKVITFDKSSLKFLCDALKVPYDEKIIAFTKSGPVTNVFDLVDQVKDK